MYYKNIQIILVFITLVLNVLSSPINKKIDKNSNIHVIKKCLNTKKKIINNEIDSSIDNEFKSEKNTTELIDTKITDVPFEFSLNLDITPEEINTICTGVVNNVTTTIEKLLLIPDEECSFESIIAPIFYRENELEYVSLYMRNGLSSFAKNPNSKSAAKDCVNLLQDTKNQALIQIFSKIIKTLENFDTGKANYPEDPEDIRLLNIINNYLNDSNMNKDAIALKRELSEIVNDFEDCVNNDNTTVIFTKNELDGLSEKMLNDYETTTKNGEEAYIIKINNSNCNNVINYAKNENTRRITYKLKHTICKSNIERFREVINIRTKIANISGYETFSDYQLKDLMAKDLKTAIDFLEDLKQKLQVIAKKDIEKMLKLKNKERIKSNETTTDAFNYWDQAYYKRLLKEEESGISFEEANEYFPADMIIIESIKLFEELYSLKFIKNENPSVWDDSVLQYDVYDKITNKYMGKIYLDLFSYEGKDIGGVTYSLGMYTKKEDGSELYPSCVVSLSIAKSTTSEQKLFSHSDITALFHELGHGIHFVNIKSKWLANVFSFLSPDYAEIFSQMQENLAWEPTILERLSHHYKDHNKRIPKNLIDGIIGTRNIGLASYNLDDMSYSIGDLKLYSMGEIDKDFDIVKFWDDIQEDVTTIKIIDEYWDFAIMDHLVSIMPSSYYTYLWSLVYAYDVYSKFSENGIINPEIGLEYRNTVLKSSGHVDSMDDIREFLGREPNNDAFIKVIGI